MATPSRFFQKGFYYHIYNRGNRKQEIFTFPKDYMRFLNKTKEYKDELGISILCYCLMFNHFHFLIKQETSRPISIFMLRLQTSYAKYFNIRHEVTGSLFEDRFKAKLIEKEEYLLELSRYIHRNPLASTRGVELESYRWSSYKNYVRNLPTKLVNTKIILDYFKKNKTSSDYRKFVEYDFKENFLDSIKDLIIEDSKDS